MKKALGTLAVFLVLAIAIGTGIGGTRTTVRAASSTTITMPADRFAPFAQTVSVGDTVTWQNKDTDLHTVVSVPANAPDALNLTVKPGNSATFTFAKPGLYWYYCNLHATWDPDSGQVKALPTVDNPAEPMEGTILVLGTGQASAPAPVVAPGDTFTPFVTTVTTGSTVSWQNKDTDLHTVTSVPGNAPAPISFNLKAGSSASMTFTEPGLYWFYCTLHATWDADSGQVEANSTSDEPSEPMMGVIAVLAAPAAATPTASPTATATVAAATPTAVATPPPTAAPTQPPLIAPAPPKTGSGQPQSHGFRSFLLPALLSLMVAIPGGIAWFAFRNSRRGNRS